MGSIEDRLRRLEQKLEWEPTLQEYVDAKYREEARLHKGIVEKLEAYPGFPGQRLYTERDRRMLAGDTPEQRDRDQETIEKWHRAQGIDREAEAQGAKETLETMLKQRGEE